MKLKMLIAGTMCTFMAVSLTGCGSKEANNAGGGYLQLLKVQQNLKLLKLKVMNLNQMTQYQ